MAEPQFIDFKPEWMKRQLLSRLADTPNTGFEPPLSPRLPTRIIPTGGSSTISAISLSESIVFTQRILNYVSYELVHGVQPGFADLRSVEEGVLRLAKLSVEPFEQGSFVIPAALPEEDVRIGNTTYTSNDVIEHFVEVMERIPDPKYPTSIGLVQAVDDLGKILRREASRIEYYPAKHAVIVDHEYIGSVSRSNLERRNPKYVADSLEGVVTAVDIVRATFNLRLDGKATVKGRFESMISENMMRSLNARVKLSGVVEYHNNYPKFIRAFYLESLED